MYPVDQLVNTAVSVDNFTSFQVVKSLHTLATHGVDHCLRGKLRSGMVLPHQGTLADKQANFPNSLSCQRRSAENTGIKVAYCRTPFQTPWVRCSVSDLLLLKPTWAIGVEGKHDPTVG